MSFETFCKEYETTLLNYSYNQLVLSQVKRLAEIAYEEGYSDGLKEYKKEESGKEYYYCNEDYDRINMLEEIYNLNGEYSTKGAETCRTSCKEDISKKIDLVVPKDFEATKEYLTQYLCDPKPLINGTYNYEYINISLHPKLRIDVKNFLLRLRQFNTNTHCNPTILFKDLLTFVECWKLDNNSCGLIIV